VRLVVALWLIAGNAVAQEPCDARKLERLERRLTKPRQGNYAVAANGLVDACSSTLPPGFDEALRTYARSPKRSILEITRTFYVEGFYDSARRMLCSLVPPASTWPKGVSASVSRDQWLAQRAEFYDRINHPPAAFDRCGMDAFTTRTEVGDSALPNRTGVQLAGAMVSVLDEVEPHRRRLILRALAGLDIESKDVRRR
jgi:hypothetical protein